MKKKFRYLFFISILCAVLQPKAYSQFSISGQLRTRSELRQGQGTLPEASKPPAFFTSQRTRLSIGYSAQRLTFFTSVQDVRTWGQDISTINRTSTDVNDGLMLHEAWADLSLLDTGSLSTLNLKIGRQELVYNDSRLLGNLDWLQQGRRHELALLKFSFKKFSWHMGAAFNQNKEGKSGTIYNGSPVLSGYPNGYTAGTNSIGTMYKTLQFTYLKMNHKSGNISLLFLKDDFNKYAISENTILFKKGVWSRLTGGTDLDLLLNKKLKIINTIYYQGGRTKDGKELSAYLFSIYSFYRFSSKLSVGPGMDFTSGNNGVTRSGKDKAFDPLYGTAHKFWGYMDYFYAADPFGDRGLTDYYIKTKYSPIEKLFFTLDLHQFYSSGKVENTSTPEADYLNPSLGTEIDFTSTYLLTNYIALEGGYCIMFGTSTLDRIKLPVTNKRNIGQWAYLMISIKSEFFKTQFKNL